MQYDLGQVAILDVDDLDRDLELGTRVRRSATQKPVEKCRPSTSMPRFCMRFAASVESSPPDIRPSARIFGSVMAMETVSVHTMSVHGRRSVLGAGRPSEVPPPDASR